MKEIWQASFNPQDWPGRPVPSLLPLWWAFWLILFPLGRLDWILWERLDETSGVDDFIAANIAAQAAAVWVIPLTLLLLAIMNRIHRMQVEHRRGSRTRIASKSVSNREIDAAVEDHIHTYLSDSLSQGGFDEAAFERMLASLKSWSDEQNLGAWKRARIPGDIEGFLRGPCQLPSEVWSPLVSRARDVIS